MDIRHNPKRVVREGYVGEEELEAHLEEIGVDSNMLAKDLQYFNLEQSVYNTVSCVFQLSSEEVTVFATKEAGEPYICDWLDAMDIEEFRDLWKDREFQKVVAALMRYPGGLHEWLMIEAIPLLKEMGISLEMVKTYRTPTEATYFLHNGELSYHGKAGSTTMHNDLFRCIVEAYSQWKQVGRQPLLLIQAQLREFVKEYYAGLDMPDELQELLK